MKRKVPPGTPVLIRYENNDAFSHVNGWRGTASPALFASIKEIAGPVGVLWTTEKVPEGIAIYFLKDEHAIEVALRWG
jgi:hypothetical protein